MDRLFDVAATPAASLFFGLLAVSLLVFKKYHKSPDNRLARRRIATVFLLSASAYTFSVCFVLDIVLDYKSVAESIESGFGNERVSWLMFGVVLDSFLRVWDNFRPAP